MQNQQDYVQTLIQHIMSINVRIMDTDKYSNYLKEDNSMSLKLKEFFIATSNSNFIDEYSFSCIYHSEDVTEEDKQEFIAWMEENECTPLAGRGMIAWQDKDGKTVDLKKFAKEMTTADIEAVIKLSRISFVRKQCRALLEKRKVREKKEYHTDIITTKYYTETKTGWLSPTGEFIELTWGEHEEWAGEYILRHGLGKDQAIFKEEGGENYSKDYLIHRRNFILLDNPSLDGHVNIVLQRSRFMTNAQEKFLVDFLLEIGDNETMNELFGD